jgi:hypothetical protein
MTQNQSRMICFQFIWNTRANDTGSIVECYSSFIRFAAERRLLWPPAKIRQLTIARASTYSPHSRRYGVTITGLLVTVFPAGQYVCMYVCMYPCMYVFAYIHTLMYDTPSTQPYIHITRVYMCVYVCEYLQYVTHTYMVTVSMYVCMYACMYVCICIYTYINVRYTNQSDYTRIYVCICM